MHTVRDLTVEELKEIVGDAVEERLRELLMDPDAGLTLRPEVEARLKQQLQNPQVDGDSVPAAEVARRLGLEW